MKVLEDNGDIATYALSPEIQTALNRRAATGNSLAVVLWCRVSDSLHEFYTFYAYMDERYGRTQSVMSQENDEVTLLEWIDASTNRAPRGLLDIAPSDLCTVVIGSSGPMCNNLCRSLYPDWEQAHLTRLAAQADYPYQTT